MVASRIPGNAKRSWLLTLAMVGMVTLSAGIGHAEEEGIDKAQAEAFDVRLFAKSPGKKAYACFVRRYDPDHLARHPQQKVSAMKLLVSAEVPPEEQTTTNYSFRLGLKYRHKSGDFDSSGSCRHVLVDDTSHELRLGCGVDCDGGGIQVAMSKDDNSAIVQFERIRIWRHNKHESLVAGVDDKSFGLDRTDIRECASLVTDRKEFAALRRK